MSVSVSVVGARGRMGSAVCEAVRQAADLELLAQLDKSADTDSRAAIAQLAGRVQVAVEFTTPPASKDNVHALIESGIHAVVGTTGWTQAKLERIRDHLASAPHVGVLIAPNFAIGAVLAMQFAAQAARFFTGAEVIELHHPNKLDAPSGTARQTAIGIGKAWQQAGIQPGPDSTESGWQARGANVAGVRVHAVRLPGLVAHEEILFSNPGELLTIRHDSFDRSSFLPGVLMAVRKVGVHPGLTVGLDRYLT